MKRHILEFSALALGASLLATNVSTAFAEDDLQTILDNTTTNPAGDSSVDVTTDALDDSMDSYWTIGAAGGAVATFIIEIAGYAENNILGIYDAADNNNWVTVFDGSEATGSQAFFGIGLDGTVTVFDIDTLGITATSSFAGNSFGFLMNNTVNDGGFTWYSDTSLNHDKTDHMLAFAGQGDTVQIASFAAGMWGSNEYVLAWEDLENGGDKDYNDMVVMIESVSPAPVPVPVPAAAVLFGSAMVGLAGIARRKKTLGA